MSDTTTLSLSWDFLLKALAVGAITYIVWPTMFVLRSWLTQGFIRGFMINDDLRRQLNEHRIGNELHRNLGAMNNAETSAQIRDQLKEAIGELEQDKERIEAGLRNVTTRIDWVRQHFQMQDYDTGIEQWLRQSNEAGRRIGFSDTADPRLSDIEQGRLSLEGFIKIRRAEIRERVKPFSPL